MTSAPRSVPELPREAHPELPRDAHKGRAGRVLVVAGSRTMPGAAILCVRAAQRAGAGLVELACLDEALLAVVPQAAPEAILSLDTPGELFAAGQADAWVCGPGLGAHRNASWLAYLPASEASIARPLVLDADGLNAFAGAPERLAGFASELVLTPHPGEAARLLSRAIPVDDEGRIDAARELATRAGAVCCLKGAGTVVTDGERVHVNTTGNPGMATAGSGDVLAGVLGAYLAAARQQALQTPEGGAWDTFAAAVAGVHVHGLAGDLAVGREGGGLGQLGLVASDLITWLPRAQLEFARESG